MKLKTDWPSLYSEAHRAGMDAGSSSVPTPMVVQQHSNVMNDNSPVVQQWNVPDGVCGFAWVVVRPANSPFANWLKKNNLARAHYRGGVSVWVGEFNQSMTRKEAYAAAFAQVLHKAGLNAHSDSRMD